MLRFFPAWIRSARGGGEGLPRSLSQDSTEAGDHNSPHHHQPHRLLVLVESLEAYPGESPTGQAEALIATAPVVVFGHSWCPFTEDAVVLLTEAQGVETHLVPLDRLGLSRRAARQVLRHVQLRQPGCGGCADRPVVFVRGQCLGGCRELLERHASGELARHSLRGLFRRPRARHAGTLETARLAPPFRGAAVPLPAWFPPHVNDDEVRLGAGLLAVLSVAAAALALRSSEWARWVVFVAAVDQLACLLAGPAVSPIGALAMTLLARRPPALAPGACKQVTALVGFLAVTAACVCYFIGYSNSMAGAGASVGAAGYLGCVLMALLAAMWLVECVFGAQTGRVMLDWGFRIHIFPKTLYRMYTFTRREALDTWIYRFTNSEASKPIHAEPRRTDPLGLKYKKKSEDWGKDDFDPIRHMRITYFAMPASIAGLALVYKVGGSLNTGSLMPVSAEGGEVIIQIQTGWFQAFSSVAAFIFIFMMFMYFTKALLFFEKVKKEWYSTDHSSSFSYIFISCTIFGFLLYDDGHIDSNPDRDSSTQVLGRVLYWIGAVMQVIFCIAKVAEWISRRLQLEHVNANWALLSFGLALTGFCTPIVGALSHYGPYDSGNAWLGRFYVAFAQIIFTPIFVITLYKAIIGHNSDFRQRHSLWLWVAAQCMLGLSDYTICEYDYASRVENVVPNSGPLNPLICGDRPVRQVAGGVFLFLILAGASLPRSGFFFRDDFSMNHWVICIPLNTLSAAATFFYTTNGWFLGLVAEMITVVCATFAHVIIVLHTVTGLIRKHGVCTSADNWGPLTLFRYAHAAFRENRATLEFYLSVIDLEDVSPEGVDNLGLFAAHFNRFRIVHEEHLLHETILISAIRELFPFRSKKCDDDHQEIETCLLEFGAMINEVLDSCVSLDHRNEVLSTLQVQLPLLLNRLEMHMRGEEYDIFPVAEKYFCLDRCIELIREIWSLTPTDKWEVIIDFYLNNLPRHTQRSRFLRLLVWCLPERAQQIGALVYPNVDAIMWERLRCDIPAIVPRGLPHWKRYD